MICPVVIRPGGTRQIVSLGEALRHVVQREEAAEAPPEEHADHAEIVAEYVAGVKIADIALAHGVSETTVIKAARAAGIPHRNPVPRRPPIPPETIEAILHDRREGPALRALCTTYRLAYTRVRSILAPHGLTASVRRGRAYHEAEIVARLRAGERADVIAADLGLAESTVVIVRRERIGAIPRKVWSPEEEEMLLTVPCRAEAVPRYRAAFPDSSRGDVAILHRLSILAPGLPGGWPRLSAEERTARRKMQQQRWREANRDRVRETGRAYAARTREKERERKRVYRAANHERFVEYQREYRAMRKVERGAEA